MAKKRTGKNLRKSISAIEKNVLSNSIPSSLRNKIIRENNKNSTEVTNELRKSNKKKSVRKAVPMEIKNLLKRQKEEFSKGNKFLKDNFELGARNIAKSAKTGSTISDEKAYKLGIGASIMGDMDDFDMDDDFDLSGDESFSSEDDMDFDMMDDGDDSDSSSASSTIMYNDTGAVSVAKISQVIGTSVTSLIEINSSGFNAVNENLANISEMVLENNKSTIDLGLELVKSFEKIRSNTKVSNVSQLRTQTSIEDLLLGDLSVSNLLSYLDEESSPKNALMGIGDKMLQTLKDSMFAKKPGKSKKNIFDIPGVSNVILGVSDKLEHGDFSGIENFINKTREKLPGNKYSSDREGDIARSTRTGINNIRKFIKDKTFLGKLDRDGKISTANIMARGTAVAFDAETHNSINTVIPGYLAKILSSITGRSELFYDYKSGRWKTQEDAAKMRQKSIDDSLSNSSLSDFIEKMTDKERKSLGDIDTKKINEVVKHLTGSDIKDKESLSSHKGSMKSIFGEELVNVLFGQDDKNIGPLMTRINKYNIFEKSKSFKEFSAELGGSMMNAFNSDKINNSRSRSSNIRNSMSGINIDRFITRDDKAFERIHQDLVGIRNLIRSSSMSSFSGTSEGSYQDLPVESGSYFERMKSEAITRTKDKIKETGKNKIRELIPGMNNQQTMGPAPTGNILPQKSRAQAPEEENKGTNFLVDQAKDKLEDTFKNQVKNQLGNLKTKAMNSKAGQKVKNVMLSSKAGRTAASTSANLASAAAVKGGSKVAGKVTAKAGAKAGAAAIPGIGWAISGLLMVPDLFKTISNPIDSLKNPLQTIGSFIGLSEHPGDEAARMEENSGAGLRSSLKGSANDKIPSTKINSNVSADPKQEARFREYEKSGKDDLDMSTSDMSEGSRNLLKNSSALLLIPGGAIVAHQLYEHILSPILGAGTNILHKTLGMAGVFGKKSGEAMEERTSFLGNLFGGLVNGTLGIVGGIGQGVAGALAGGIGMIGEGVSSLYSMITGGKEEIEDMTEEMIMAGDATSTVMFGEDGFATDMEEEHEKLTSSIGENSEHMAKSLNKQTENTYKTSGLGMSMQLSKEFDSMLNGNKALADEVRNRPEDAADKMLKMSPMYTLASASSSTSMPNEHMVEGKIGEWFDKMGYLLKVSQENLASGGSMSGGAHIIEDAGYVADQDNRNLWGRIKDGVSSGVGNLVNFVTGGSNRKYNVHALNLVWNSWHGRDGCGYHPVYNRNYAQITRGLNGGAHYGIDLDYKLNQPQKTPVAGEVIFTGREPYGANVVSIYDGTYTLLFVHLNSISVRVGQRVKAGDVIGAAGKTGAANTPHLHLQVQRGRWTYLRNNQQDTVDPEAWMAMANGGTPVSIKYPNSSKSSSGVSALDPSGGSSIQPPGSSGGNYGEIQVAPDGQFMPMQSIDFEKDQGWRGTITGRDKPYAEFTEEDEKAFDARMNKRLSRQYGVSIEELEEATRQLKAKQRGESSFIIDGDGFTGDRDPTTGIPTPDGQYPNIPSPDDGGSVITPGKGGSMGSITNSIINEIVNYYDNSNNSLVINNTEDITNIRNIRNIFTNKSSAGVTPNFNKDLMDEMSDILKHTNNISDNTKKIAENLGKLRQVIPELLKDHEINPGDGTTIIIDRSPGVPSNDEDVIYKDKDGNIKFNIEKLIDEILDKLRDEREDIPPVIIDVGDGRPASPISEELGKYANNYFNINQSIASSIFKGL